MENAFAKVASVVVRHPQTRTWARASTLDAAIKVAKKINRNVMPTEFSVTVTDATSIEIDDFGSLTFKDGSYYWTTLPNGSTQGGLF